MKGYYYEQVNPKAKGTRMVPHYLEPFGYRSYHSGEWHVQGTQPCRDGGFARSFRTADHNRYFTEPPPLPGRSLAPVLQGESIGREFLYWNHAGNRALRIADWKAVFTPYHGDEWELYNIAEDRGETADLAKKQPERYKKERKRQGLERGTPVPHHSEGFGGSGLPRSFLLASRGSIGRIRAPSPSEGGLVRRSLGEDGRVFEPHFIMSGNNSFSEITAALRDHQSFAVLSHVRPDGDAIGSQLAMGFMLEAMGKKVVYLNEDGLPDNLTFLPGSERIEQPDGPVEIDVALALDTATKPRLGERVLEAVGGAGLWINIDHHISNPGYGDLNHIDGGSPATCEIIYDLIVDQDLPFPDETRDSIYVGVSTDTGSFQYPSTTARTYDMAADLVRRGLDVGRINSQTYDNYPYRRLQLMRALLNTLERSADGRLADWQLTMSTRRELEVLPEDSEGLIDTIRAIRGVIAACFFEELEDGRVRVSMRSKDRRIDVCQVAMKFGGGGHALAAGIRMKGPFAEARAAVLEEIRTRFEAMDEDSKEAK
jgi:phosphoesterase RecJ-like protein